MAIIFYISLLLSPPFLLIWLAWRYGSFSRSKITVLWHPFLAIPLTFFYTAWMHSWGFEGTNSLIFVFYGINILIVLAGFQGKKLWALGFLVLFYSVSLELFHSHLARSSDYTDSPPWRSKHIAGQNRRRLSLGLPLLPKVDCKPEWHTFLTQLYAVHPKS